MSAFAVPESVKCQNCLEKAGEVRCKDCVNQEYLCHICDCKVHEQLPFHDREAIVNGHFGPIPATTARSSKGEWLIVERYLPLSNIRCTSCYGNCKALDILPSSHCIVITVKDGSKQRQRLRTKISNEKEKLKGMIEKYNGLVAVNECVRLQEVENGDFPWKAETHIGDAVPVRNKRVVVDKHMETMRFKEELELLQKEMLSFMKFYKTTVVPSLQQQQTKLKDLLKEPDCESRVTEDQFSKCEYSTSSTKKEVVMAKLSHVSDGIDFAMKQIAVGVTAFAPVITDDLDIFRQVLLTHHFEDSSDELEGDEDEDENEDGDEEMESTSRGNLGSSATVDVIVTALEQIDSLQLFNVQPESLSRGVTCWNFPVDASQGRYNGRNGSNACSLISLLIGYCFNLKKIPPPPSHLNLSDNIIRVVCGCIEVGNRVYDLYRDSLPSRYLSVHEAASVLDNYFVANVSDNFPVRLKDPHEQSTIVGQLNEASKSRSPAIGFLILNEKTSLFYVNEGVVMYIDTHIHGTSGSVVITAMIEDLDDFCEAVWKLEDNDEMTFGNFVFMSF